MSSADHDDSDAENHHQPPAVVASSLVVKAEKILPPVLGSTNLVLNAKMSFEIPEQSVNKPTKCL